MYIQYPESPCLNENLKITNSQNMQSLRKRLRFVSLERLGAFNISSKIGQLEKLSFLE